MPLENLQGQLLQQKENERLQIMLQGPALENAEQADQTRELQKYQRKIQELSDTIQFGWVPAVSNPTQAAPQRIPTTYSDRKRLKKQRKSVEDILAQTQKFYTEQTRIRNERAAAAQQEMAGRQQDDLEDEMEEQPQDQTQMLEKEKAFLKMTLETINAQQEFRLKKATTEKKKLKILLECQKQRAQAAGTYAKLLPLNSPERIKALEVKEEEEIKANHFKKRLEILRKPHGPERENAESTLSRHGRYDTMKGIMRWFKGRNPLSLEERAYATRNGTHLVNKGRAFFGGTKPMYIFEDEHGNQYLYKEAINCVGFDKPQGALVTEAASVLQRSLCGANHSIPAEIVEVNGKIVGSLQKKVDLWRQGDPGNPPPDLFKWQQNPDNTLNANTQQMAEIRDGLLREHALDWLLCNFDTKGENFLFDRNGDLVSFDKEASFSHLSDAGAQDMSYDYVPHSNDTIYNVLFRRYAQGDQVLDLTCTKRYVAQIEAMDDNQYMQPFQRMLEEKYGVNTKKYHENYQKILQRKRQIRDKYEAFYQRLIAERRQNLQRKGLPDDTVGLLNANGKFFP